MEKQFSDHVGRARQEQMRLEEMALEAAERTWEWRNLRQVGFGVTFWPFQWGLGVNRWSDKFGGTIDLSIGPFDFTFSFNAGASGVARLASE